MSGNMNFAETMATNPPRLVVTMGHNPDGAETFQWGITGSMPLLTLVGYISRVQSQLLSCDWMPECDTDPPALVVAFDESQRSFAHFRHPDIPDEPLVGMLETIKAMLVASRMGQHAAAQRVGLLGTDGKPMR